MQFRKEQIDRIFTGLVVVPTVSVNGVSVNATVSISNALATAAFGGTALAAVNSASEATPGLIVSSLNYNKVQVFLSSTKKPVYFSGEKVYGRLTYSASVYTISLYYNNSGVETPYTTGGAVNLDFLITYRFKFSDIPSDYFVSTFQKYPYVDYTAATGQGRLVEEKLNVTALNTVSSLSFVPTPNTKVTLYVNGKAEVGVGGTPPFTISGNVITWSTSNAEYDLLTTFNVVASYQTLS